MACRRDRFSRAPTLRNRRRAAQPHRAPTSVAATTGARPWRRSCRRTQQPAGSGQCPRRQVFLTVWRDRVTVAPAVRRDAVGEVFVKVRVARARDMTGIVGAPASLGISEHEAAIHDDPTRIGEMPRERVGVDEGGKIRGHKIQGAREINNHSFPVPRPRTPPLLISALLHVPAARRSGQPAWEVLGE